MAVEAPAALRLCMWPSCISSMFLFFAQALFTFAPPGRSVPCTVRQHTTSTRLVTFDWQVQAEELSNFLDTSRYLKISPFLHRILGYQLFYQRPCGEIGDLLGRLGKWTWKMQKLPDRIPFFTHFSFLSEHFHTFSMM